MKNKKKLLSFFKVEQHATGFVKERTKLVIRLIIINRFLLTINSSRVREQIIHRRRRIEEVAEIGSLVN